MKWLYRILRLFFCPHKWKHEGEISVMSEGYDIPTGILQKCQCKYCGKWRTFRT